jgi:hypothetical protein
MEEELSALLLHAEEDLFAVHTQRRTHTPCWRILSSEQS